MTYPCIYTYEDRERKLILFFCFTLRTVFINTYFHMSHVTRIFFTEVYNKTL